jgi:hypothetical protein
MVAFEVKNLLAIKGLAVDMRHIRELIDDQAIVR